MLIGVSQPFATLPSQSAKPAEQAILHTPPTQVPVPPLWLQAWPQPPQLFGSFAVLISQPFATLLSQSANPVLHFNVHFEDTQDGVALFVLQAWLQPPQLWTSFVMFVSQPFAGLPSHSAVPACLQVETVQTWFVQTSLALVCGHAWPQEPQLFGSNAIWISHPSDAMWLQSAKPVVQLLTAHDAALHVSTALLVLHAPLQDPQCLGSVLVFTHAEPAPPPGGHNVGVGFGHEAPQLLPSQVGVPFVGVGQSSQDAPHELVESLRRHFIAAPTPQLCVFGGQTQLPPSQTVPPEQAFVQVPQWF